MTIKLEPDGRISRNQRFDREQIDALFDERDDLLAKVERLRDALKDVEGTLLSYWTDIPESEVQRLLSRISDQW